jgi:hypothetical protein
MLLGGLILLFLIHLDYIYIIAYFVIAFILTLNRDNKVVEVYNDRFNIITPSFYGNKFADTETYYFKEINNFEFEKGYYDWKAATLGEIARMFLPVVFMGILFAYKNPTITFTEEPEKKTNIEFSYNQDSLIKAIELIDTKIKTHKTTNIKRHDRNEHQPIT